MSHAFVFVSVKQKKGIRIKDLNTGTGRAAELGPLPVIKYQGFLNKGDKVASSDDQPGEEYRFKVGRRDPTAMPETVLSECGKEERGRRA